MPRPARATLWALYAFAGWFLLLNLPIVLPEPSIDLSWAAVLHYAWAANWQFGRDIVITYGPLGFLHVGIYTPETWPYFLAYQVVQRAFYIALVCRLGLRLPRLAQLVFLSGSVLLPTLDSDSFYFLFVTLVGALLTAYRLPLTAYRLPLTAYRAPLAARRSLGQTSRNSRRGFFVSYRPDQDLIALSCFDCCCLRGSPLPNELPLACCSNSSCRVSIRVHGTVGWSSGAGARQPANLFA